MHYLKQVKPEGPVIESDYGLPVAIGVYSEVHKEREGYVALPRGEVKRFNNRERIGSIKEDGEDVAPYFSAAQLDGLKTVTENERGKYDYAMAKGQENPQVADVGEIWSGSQKTPTQGGSLLGFLANLRSPNEQCCAS